MKVNEVLLLGLLGIAGYFAYRFIKKSTAPGVMVVPGAESDQAPKGKTSEDVQITAIETAGNVLGALIDKWDGELDTTTSEDDDEYELENELDQQSDALWT